MSKLQIPRSQSSDRSSFRPALRPFAPARKSTPGAIQAKLTLGPVGDSYEREADDTARQVMQQIGSPATPGMDVPAGVQRAATPADEDDLMKKPLPGAIQRVAPEDDDMLNKKPMAGAVQREGGMGGGPIGQDVESSIEGARSGGRALDGEVRASMEPAFGADFSGVRVHSDAKSDGLNRTLQARAFTTGQDVFFRSGEYNPGSSGGKELLAHELTHVVQQNGPGVMKKPDDQKTLAG